jgi:ABC-2 type transport system permease protein
MENDLKKVTLPEFQYLHDDWFDNITLFDNRAVAASYSQLPDGKYQVRISVEAKKYRADGKGQEHQIPPHDLIDIGVLDADGNFLYPQRHEIEQEQQQFTVTVDKVPAKAGIDPLIKLIDRNPDDNLTDVKKQ